MSAPQPTTESMPGDARERLARAIAAASATGADDSTAVCDAVEAVVGEAKAAGQPPERVLVVLKTLALRVLDQLRMPLDRARVAIAWIVRCAVKAYYRA